MGKIKPKHRKIHHRHTAFYSVVAVCAILVATLGITAKMNYWHLLLIDSNSMRPAWSAGAALVVIQKPTSQVHPGDIIAVVPPKPFPQITYVHRVIRIKEVSAGHYIARTKGDNNPTPDPWHDVLASHVQTVLVVIPYLGYLIAIITSPFWIIGIIALLVASLLKRVPKHRMDKRKAKAKSRLSTA